MRISENERGSGPELRAWCCCLCSPQSMASLGDRAQKGGPGPGDPLQIRE